jgi:hypothetical protein
VSADREAHPILNLRARLSNLLSVGTGWCGCCGRRWGTVDEHVVNYTSRSGAFAICEECWPSLTVEQRVGHMRRHHGNSGSWNLIEAATRTAE